MMVGELRDNNIQWYSQGNSTAKTATASFYQKKFVNKIKKLAQSHPDEVEIIAENKDGSICAHFPVGWVKVSPPRVMSEERKAEMTERMRVLREKQLGKEDTQS